MEDIDSFVEALEHSLIKHKGFLQISGEATDGYWVVVTGQNFNMVRYIETQQFMAMLMVLQVHRPELSAIFTKAISNREATIKLAEQVYNYNHQEVYHG